MSDWSRRRFLTATALPIVGASAGCSASPGPTESKPDASFPKRQVTDYEMAKVRNGKGVPLVEGGSATGRSETYDHITDRANVPSFTQVSEAQKLVRFVGATDFATESVLLLVRSIPECYDLRLVSVSKESDGVGSQYCREMRPADVGCERDAEDTVGVAIRLPFAGDSFNSLGMGYSSSCDDRPRVVDFEPVTPANTAVDATGNATAETEGKTE
ncbi:MAG: hypothetical protein ABEK02_08645 [Haloquadratum sp.]